MGSALDRVWISTFGVFLNVICLYFSIEDVGTTSELFLEPFHQARGRGSLLQTIREVPETVSPVSDDTDANEHEEPMDQNELEVQSELSYTSAYSSPMGSTASLNTGTNYVQLKETSV